MKLRYDLIGAFMLDITEHPQKQMKKLGIEYNKSEAVPIGDCWIFSTEKEYSDLPSYIDIII